VLVVVEQPDDLFLHHFWPITDLSPGRYDGEQLLALYRQRSSTIALRRGRGRANCIQSKATTSHSRKNPATSLTRNRRQARIIREPAYTLPNWLNFTQQLQKFPMDKTVFEIP